MRIARDTCRSCGIDILIFFGRDCAITQVKLQDRQQHCNCMADEHCPMVTLSMVAHGCEPMPANGRPYKKA
jgi:hypothetical protein